MATYIQILQSFPDDASKITADQLEQFVASHPHIQRLYKDMVLKKADAISKTSVDTLQKDKDTLKRVIDSKDRDLKFATDKANDLRTHYNQSGSTHRQQISTLKDENSKLTSEKCDLLEENKKHLEEIKQLLEFKNSAFQAGSKLVAENEQLDFEKGVLLMCLEAMVPKKLNTRWIIQTLPILTNKIKDQNKFFNTDFRFSLSPQAPLADRELHERKRVQLCNQLLFDFDEIHPVKRIDDCKHLPPSALTWATINAPTGPNMDRLPPKNPTPTTTLTYDIGIDGREDEGPFRCKFRVEDGRIVEADPILIPRLRDVAEDLLNLGQLIIDEVGWEWDDEKLKKLSPIWMINT